MVELVEFFSYGFVQKALISGVILSISASLLGVIVLLRRMSFFSDAIAHASLLGIALGLIIQIHPTIGAIAGSILVGLFIAWLTQKRKLSSDTIIGVVFSSSVALAVFIISILDKVSVDLTALLFGNILAVSTQDIWLAGLVLILTLLFLRFYLKKMLKTVFSYDLARVEEKGVELMDYTFLALLALVIAISLKIIGAILVSALIIIPAATAQNLSRNLKQMFLLSLIIGIVSVLVGMFFSFVFDSPSGATIVLSSSFLFLISLFFRK